MATNHYVFLCGVHDRETYDHPDVWGPFDTPEEAVVYLREVHYVGCDLAWDESNHPILETFR